MEDILKQLEETLKNSSDGDYRLLVTIAPFIPDIILRNFKEGSSIDETTEQVEMEVEAEIDSIMNVLPEVCDRLVKEMYAKLEKINK